MSWIAAAVVGSAVVGGVVSSNAASNAADAQSNAAGQASNAQVEAARISSEASLTASREANQIVKEQNALNRQDLAPYREAGAQALAQQSAGTRAGGQFDQSYGVKFDPSQITLDPGYDFRTKAGLKAVEGSAAARGSLLSGGTLKALTDYGQDAASQEYGAAYNRYNSAYSDAYNRYNSDRDRRFNRLSAIAGTGQTATNNTVQSGTAAAGQTSGNITAAGNTVANNATATGNALASNYIGAGNAQAAGAVGQANALTGAIGQGINGYMSLNTLAKLNSGGAGSGVLGNASAYGSTGTNYNSLAYVP